MSIEVTYRLAREDDLSAMRLIQSKALYDLVVTRSGRDPSAIPITDEPSTEMRHLLRTNPKLAWIATEGGRELGFSVGFVREELWFLSDLFVLPEAYGKGIGGELLRRCLEAGDARGARVRAVASSGDHSAQRLYIQAGMVPRFPLFGIDGPARRLMELPAPRARAAIKEVTFSRSWLRRLGDLDAKIWGRRRDGDHRFWLGECRFTCLAMIKPSGGVLAYAYFSSPASTGPWSREAYRIGPVAASGARQQLLLLRAIGDAMKAHGDASIEFRVPGINMTALSALLAAGFTIDHVGQYMASKPFGRFDRYLPSGGTLL